MWAPSPLGHNGEPLVHETLPGMAFIQIPGQVQLAPGNHSGQERLVKSTHFCLCQNPGNLGIILNTSRFPLSCIQSITNISQLLSPLKCLSNLSTLLKLHCFFPRSKQLDYYKTFPSGLQPPTFVPFQSSPYTMARWIKKNKHAPKQSFLSLTVSTGFPFALRLKIKIHPMAQRP